MFQSYDHKCTATILWNTVYIHGWSPYNILSLSNTNNIKLVHGALKTISRMYITDIGIFITNNEIHVLTYRLSWELLDGYVMLK